MLESHQLKGDTNACVQYKGMHKDKGDASQGQCTQEGVTESKAHPHLRGEWKKRCLQRKLRRVQGYQEKDVLEVQMGKKLRCLYFKGDNEGTGLRG